MSCSHCGADTEGTWIDFGCEGPEWIFVCPECEGRMPTQYLNPREELRVLRAMYALEDAS